ncbi:MAG: zf-HC2 domain-containing protein [Verrucomicrobiales bacterium]|nr:zf-HC2 domain-containing protein [Verrucomicrobiales bacterium]
MPDPNPTAEKACTEFEDAILECFEEMLSETERQKVEIHVAGCAGCRAFWNEQKRLDAVLATTFRHSALPQDFKQGILERVQAVDWAAPMLATAGVSGIDAALAQLRRDSREQTFWSALDWVCYATLASLAVACGYEMLSRSGLLARLSTEQLSLYLGTVLGVAAIAGGMWIGCRGQIRLLLDWP